MRSKKVALIILVLFFMLALPLANNFYKKTKASPLPSSNNSTTKPAQNFLLENYPIDTVPLYKMKMISASKFFVNQDPAKKSAYFGQPVNYYNIVFETEATAEELLNYYQSLMTETNPDLSSSETVEGKIGQYKVSASHYGNDPKNYAYLQVYLPQQDYQGKNRYYPNYPALVDIGESWTEYESSYGLLNQKGGEVEYTQYFPLPQEEEPRQQLITTYQQKYQNETDYSFNDSTGLMTWKKDQYSIYLTFSKSHGRIYLMIRHPL